VLHDVIFGNRRNFRELLQGSEEGIDQHPQQPAQRLVAAGLLTREEATRGQRAARWWGTRRSACRRIRLITSPLGGRVGLIMRHPRTLAGQAAGV
jgi:hypothetical protein